jgi:hypothetical protein
MALAGMVAGAGASLGSIAQAAEVTYADLAPILRGRTRADGTILVERIRRR